MDGSSLVKSSAEQFKSAMRHLAGAVCVVTTGEGDLRTGFTATSVTALSADGPTIMTALNRGSSSWPALERGRHFCINVLSVDHQAVAHSFSGFGGVQGAARYEGYQWWQMETGGVALEGALASFDCELEEAIIHRSHAIVIGLVRSIATFDANEPLLYWRGAYRHLRT
ncbi:flavin reductase family protein [Agrobacterium vitis]|uniref:flavin reductase family protein n=1 Tax=Agrobacterium vitis TaxID=373 RepID=UPI0012E7BD41|nr:flavin reductase family protein [Agrobacterium vitis]MUZ66366.1 flavin reductase [Agrobacterium vitis]